MSTALKQLREAKPSKSSTGAMGGDPQHAADSIDRAIVSLTQMYAGMVPGTGVSTKETPDARAVYVMLEDLKQIKKKLVKVIRNLQDAGTLERP